MNHRDNIVFSFFVASSIVVLTFFGSPNLNPLHVFGTAGIICLITLYAVDLIDKRRKK